MSVFLELVCTGWFWLFLWLVGGTVCVAFESDLWFVGLSVAVLFAAKYLAHVLFSWEAFFAVLPWIALYIPCGIFWSFFKWYCLLLDYKDRIAEKKKEFENDYEQKKRPLLVVGFDNYDKQKDWEDFKQFRSLERPLAKKHKAKICRWIGYWPLSVLNSIFYDLVKKILNVVYGCLGGTYDKITSWALRGID